MKNTSDENNQSLASLQKVGNLKSYHEYIDDGIHNHYVKAESYLKAGKLAAAKKEFKHMVFLDPSNHDWLIRLAEISSDLGDYPNAIVYYKRAQRITQDPLVEDKIYKLMLLKGQQMLQNNK